MSKLIPLNVVITRPALVAGIMGWYEGFIYVFSQIIGADMPKHAFFVQDGVVRSYRSRRLFNAIRQFAIKHPEVILRHLRSKDRVFNTFRRSVQQVNRASRSALPSVLERFWERYIACWPANSFAFWVPQLVKRTQLGKSASTTIRLALEARAQLDPLVEATDMYRSIFRRFGRGDVKLLNLSTNEEILRYLHGKLSPSERRRIVARDKGWLLFQDHSVLLPTIKQANTYLSRLGYRIPKPALVKRTSELRGITAQPGFAKSRIRLLFRFEDNKKVHRGEIIVSPMTTPDFTPALARCSAIVTDEGGITSHAAIISRELGIPCVIATKIATKVLKDGDRVEVDADRGIVRKL